jgi:hypothetical protein
MLIWTSISNGICSSAISTSFVSFVEKSALLVRKGSADIIIQSGLTSSVMKLRLDEIQLTILRLLNDKWYENHVVGLSFHDLITQLGVNEAKVTHSIEVLVDDGLTQRSLASIQREASRYIITAGGIDVYEETLPPSQRRQ